MKLTVLQSMWAMENILPNGETLPMPEALARIKAHGFDGVTDHLMERNKALPLLRELESQGLTLEGQCFPTSIDALAPTIELAEEFRPHHITIQPNVRTRDMAEAVRLLEGWQRLAEQTQVPVYVETHRYRLTNDLWFTLELLEQLPNLKLLGDLSHYVAGHEIPFDEGGTEPEEAMLKKVMQHCYAYHGRVANREQVQVPISFAQHQLWVDAFKRLWLWGFKDWISRAHADDDLSFTCELGTRPYSITDRNNQDITDRWAESLQLKDMAQALWQQALAHSRNA